MRRLLILVVVAACSDSSPPKQVTAGCNPLIGDDCMTPFPSSFFEVADSSTATGLRVAIDDAVLPVPHGSPPLTAARLDTHDGMSPATPFVVYFKDGVDVAQLPALGAIEESVTSSSTVQIINYTTGEHVPLFAELDVKAADGAGRQALLIRPMKRLDPATRYVVALVGLHDASGKPLKAPGFAALRDKSALNPQLEPMKASYEEIFAALEGAGVARKSLTLAWDVTTASDADITGHLVAMRDQALPMVSSLTWTITSNVDDTADPNHFREVKGTFQTPSFLTDDTQTATLKMDANAQPMLRGIGTANFAIDIPQCAKTATGPLPVMVFGHGLFGDAAEELRTHFMEQAGNYLCMVEIGTDWTGLASYDYPIVVNNVLPNFNNINMITDRLQQADINAQVLTRLFLTKMKDDAAMKIGGQAVTDGSEVYYYGISNGGIQGGTFMALSEDITRGVLNVPGSEWSLLINRSTDFANLGAVLDITMPDALDQQLLLALIQPEFDYTDPVNFAPHWLQNPLPSTPVKQILVQESEGDAQVTNVSTRVLARTAGLQGIDLVNPVYGVTEVAAPQPSAYTQWDVMPKPVPPDTNSSIPNDNGAHGAIRKLVDLEAQLKAFFTPTGMVTQTCTGKCVCDLGAGTCVMAAGTN